MLLVMSGDDDDDDAGADPARRHRGRRPPPPLVLVCAVRPAGLPTGCHAWTIDSAWVPAGSCCAMRGPLTEPGKHRPEPAFSARTT